ncbi:N-acetylmuramoyl-L-alanine amidase [Selenomonas sp. AE3005]|uniref:N-acetylmuramoyl-L-alanine amidase family protein n=1 Tax=Selenomonas sp. AE3005 TaxID=1485543 RepID=UPI0004881514|nr:N-acetylmuramoyl-L-alanine amidase [Selenomonas sp. AE3005]
MKVFLNPGHAPNGNPDPGACGCGLRESDVAAHVGRLVEGYLIAAGLEVMTLQSDSLEEICDTANEWGADVFVSIHCNSAASEFARGVETFSYPGSVGGRDIAGCIQRQIVGAFGKIDNDFPDRGLKEADFYVVRNTDMPACLVELAFISNEEDAALLKHHADDFASAIARGVTDYEQAIS